MAGNEFNIETGPPPMQRRTVSRKQPKTPKWIWAAAIGLASVILLAVVPKFAMRPESPSEKLAREQNQKAQQAVDSKSLFAPMATALAAAHKGSIEVFIETKPTPTIELGLGTQFGRPSAQIHAKLKFRVTNKSGHAITALSGRYQLRKEGRKIEFHGSDFTEMISGGIEPGETILIEFLASMGETPPPPDPEKLAGAHWEIYLKQILVENDIFSTPQSAIKLTKTNAPAGNRQLDAILNMRPKPARQLLPPVKLMSIEEASGGKARINENGEIDIEIQGQ